MFLISAGVAFALTWMFGYKDAKETVPEKKEPVKEIVEEEAAETKSKEDIVYAPVEGTAIPYTEIKDEVFAAGTLGKGVGIIPARGEIVAPFDGEITMVFDTKHAIGLTSEAGTELLIHVGINTVELNGQHFTQLKETGAKVRKGEKILEFDNDAIKAAGYDTTVVVVASAPENVEIKKTGEVKELDEILKVY